MSTKVIRVAPKRRVERVRADLSHTIATSMNDLDLHAVEDAKTLVRIKGQITVVQTGNFSAQAAQLHSIVLGVAPGGNTVISASTGQSLDQDPVEQEILKMNGAIIGRSASDPGTGEQTKVYDIDTKAMRKLKPGDTINFRDIVGSETGNTSLFGTLYFWFKE